MFSDNKTTRGTKRCSQKCGIIPAGRAFRPTPVIPRRKSVGKVQGQSCDCEEDPSAGCGNLTMYEMNPISKPRPPIRHPRVGGDLKAAEKLNRIGI